MGVSKNIDNKMISYKVESGKFFERKKEAKDWISAKEFLHNAISKSKKHRAFLWVFFDELPIMSMKVTNPSTVAEPLFERGLNYEEIIDKAIKTGSCAGFRNDFVVFLKDTTQAKLSGNVRRCSRAKTKSGDIIGFVGYKDK